MNHPSTVAPAPLPTGEGEPNANLTSTTPPVADIQRRTLRLLFVSQIAGGVGMATGMSVGALLAAEMASVGVSGLVQSAAVLGSAPLAVPATRIVRRYGRAPSLASAYLVAAAGGAVIVLAVITDSVPLLFVGFFLFGGGSTAGLQARYAAVDLAPPALYGRHLSLIVWATTIGAVAGPSLAPVASRSLSPYDVPMLAAPFVYSVVLLAFAAVLLFVWLRPDPMVVARRLSAQRDERDGGEPRKAGMRQALSAVLENPAARLGVAAAAVGHLVMGGVMAMTPVHIRDGGHGDHTLRVVGIVLSLHIAGMFAFAPLTGWLSDRFGQRRVILGGITLLVAACAMAGTAGHDETRLAIGLTLLGLGWSGTMVAGSALLSRSVSQTLRPSAQGLSDMTMGLAGALAGALSGVVQQAWGYSTLASIAALATLPVIVLAFRKDD